jgi:transposase-like protein
MTIRKELIDELIAGSGGSLIGPDGLVKELTNLKNRGMKDAFIVCTDGLKGFPEAIEAIFPSTLVQTCIVHLIRASLAYVSWKERKAMAAELKLRGLRCGFICRSSRQPD